MNETTKKIVTIENIKGLTQIVQSGELLGISKSVKELKRNVNDLVTNAKAIREDAVLKDTKTQTDVFGKEVAKDADIKSKVETVKETVSTAVPTPSEVAVEKPAKTVKVESVVIEKVAVEKKTETVDTEVKEVAKVPTTTEKVVEKVEKTSPKVEKGVEKVVENAEVAVETPVKKAEPIVEEKPVPKEKTEAEKEALARASARALAIENRLKKYYSENPREGNNQQGRTYNNSSNSGYNNNNNGGNNGNNGYNRTQTPRPPRLDKDGKPIPFVPRTGTGYQGNNYQAGYQGGQSNGYQGNNNGQRPYSPRPNTGFGSGGFDKDKDGQARPGMVKKPMGKPPMAGFAPKVDPSKQFGNKNKTKGTDQDKKGGMNKRTLIRKGFIVETSDEFDEKMGSKKLRPRKAKVNDEPMIIAPPKVISTAVVTRDIIQIKELSEKIGVTAAEITKKLFAEGTMKTVNESIDFEMAEYIAMMYNITLELKKEETAEEGLFKNLEDVDDEKDLVARPPVVTVMGHVDHGKTSLLDAIKNSSVTSGEAGGITQHIGAYSVEVNNKMITFIDTPGHEAFTSMRKRGAQITDIAILVVAADDGVMPQTIEAINHIKAAGVAMIVAINKIDKPQADIERIKNQLVIHEVYTEVMGGDAIIVPVSATTKEGIGNLLDTILLVAEYKELRANPNKKASGVVIEAQLDKGKGPMATMLVQNGTLKVGDTVISGFSTGRIRAMIDDKGRNLTKAGPSTAVSILGLSEVPEAGDKIIAVSDDKTSRAVLEERVKKSREAMVKYESAVSLEDVFKKISDGQLKNLNLIVKADVQGSAEAVKQSLLRLSNEEVAVKIIHSGAGAINESDVMLASSTSAIIIAFNVRIDAKTKGYADREKVEIRTYKIIYEAIEDIEKSLKGMLKPIYKVTATGKIEIRDVFKITGSGQIGGGYVTDGKVQKNNKVRIMRDGVEVHEGELCSLKRFKDDVKDVAQGYECGVGIKNFNDLKVGDVVECSIVEEVKRT